MNTPPATADLDPQDIARAMARHWEMDVGALTYLPLGFGSHHWLAAIDGVADQSFFVTADRVTPGGQGDERLRSALTAAWYLRHRAGIEAVVAPLSTIDGQVLVPINAGWVIALYPYLAVEKSAWGPFGNVETRHRAQQLVAHIHAVDPAGLPADTPPTEDFVIPYRAELFEYVASDDGSWNAGPYAERARVEIKRNAERIRAGFARYDTLAEKAMKNRGEWVVTHGEPHAGNIIWRADRREMVVVDWDTCAIAPRERDLWQLFPPHDTSMTGISAYVEAAGISEAAVSTDRLAMYRLRWDLAEIAIYADQFCHEHDDSEDSCVAWGGFTSSFELLRGHVRPADTPAETDGDARDYRR